MSWLTKLLGRLWTRQKPDGKSGWGALRYLLFAGILVAVGYWSLNKMDSSSSANRASSMMGDLNKKKVDPVAGDIHTGEVAAAAQETRPIDLKTEKKDALAGSKVGMGVNGDKPKSRTGQSSSFFGDAPADQARQSTQSTDSGEDSIFTALSRSEQPTTADGRPVIDDNSPDPSKGSGRRERGFMEPSVGDASGRQANTQLPPIESLIARNIRTPATPAAPQPTSSGKESVMLATHWLPRGEIIPVFLMQTVQTGRVDTLIEFAVARTVWFNGKPVLPFGTRFTATVFGSGVRDRIPFNVDSLRRRDGLEIAVTGNVLGEDKFSGMPAYYVPPPTWAQIAPYVGSFTTAFADILKQTIVESANSVSVGANGVTVANQPTPLSTKVQEAGAYAASKAMSDFMATNVAELKDRYQAYLTLPAGTFGYVQLKKNTDFSALWDGREEGQARTIGTVQEVATPLTYGSRDSMIHEANPAPPTYAQQPMTAAPLTANSPPPANKDASAPISDPLAQ